MKKPCWGVIQEFGAWLQLSVVDRLSSGLMDSSNGLGSAVQFTCRLSVFDECILESGAARGGVRSCSPCRASAGWISYSHSFCLTKRALTRLTSWFCYKKWGLIGGVWPFFTEPPNPSFLLTTYQVQKLQYYFFQAVEFLLPGIFLLIFSAKSTKWDYNIRPDPEWYQCHLLKNRCLLKTAFTLFWGFHKVFSFLSAARSWCVGRAVLIGQRTGSDTLTDI